VLTGCEAQRGSEPDVGQAVPADSPGKDPAAALKKPPNPAWTAADDAIVVPVWAGDYDHGALYTPLWRGAFPGVEDYVYTPPGADCSDVKGTVRVDWDSTANTVHFLIKTRGLPAHPTVQRTEGVNWFPAPFHAAPKDVLVSAYRLWIVVTSTTHTANFFYDPASLSLLGSDLDFPSGPPSPVSISIPILALSDSLGFDIGADGHASHQYTVPYDRFTTEGGFYAFTYATFAPTDLCEAAPFQPDISQLRPYVSAWQPPSAGMSWKTMLSKGIGFDIQIDDASQDLSATGGNLPYGYSGISVAGNVPAFKGGIPKGQAMSIVAAFRNVGPAIEPVVGGDGPGCHSYVFEPHVTAPRFCELSH
jgi:hypothetical protein